VKNWRMAGLGAVALLAVAASGWTGQGQRRAGSGDLTKAIDQYSGDEFFALVNALAYTGGQERARRCSGDPGCGNTLRTNVRVDGVVTEDSLSAGNVPPFGTVAAKAVVRGQQTEAMYGMLPNGSDGRYSYYLIVMPGAPGAATWRLEELNIQGNTRSHRMLRSGAFTPCNHPYVAGARADFKTCAQAAAGTASAQRGAMFINASFSPTRQGTEPPLWIGCASGCCTADFQ